MANTVKDVRPDPVLTRLAVEYGVGAPFASDIIAPVAKVEADNFKYAVYGREDIKLDVKSRRTVGTPAARVELAKTWVSDGVFYRSLKSDIPDEVRNNDPNGDSLNGRRTRVLVNKLRLEIEVAIATLLAAATNTKTAPGTKWDNASTTIRKEILDARDAFRKQCGMYPNIMVLPPVVKNAVFSNATILDLVKYTTMDILAKGVVPVIENMQVVTPGSIVDSSNPGAAASIADVWAVDEVYYLFVDPQAGDDLSVPTALRQVRSLAASGQPFTAKSWRDPDASANTDWVAVECNQKEVVVSQQFVLRQLDVLV